MPQSIPYIFPCFIFIFFNTVYSYIVSPQCSCVLNCSFNSALFSIISFFAILTLIFPWLDLKVSSRYIVLSFSCLIESKFVLIFAKDFSVSHWTFCCFFFLSCLKLTFYVHHKLWYFFALLRKHIRKNFLSASFGTKYSRVD